MESLKEDDYFDGDHLHEILKLSFVDSKYREVLSKQDFIDAVNEFHQSRFRYLHLSCHGDIYGIEINGEEISNYELGQIFKGKFMNKRLFLSTCRGSNRNMATAVIIHASGRSVIGTPIDLHFDKAALFWPAFYHVINRIDTQRMNKKSLEDALKRCVQLFETPINYYTRIEGDERLLKRLKIRYKTRTDNRKIRISKLSKE